jgi:hypothetical protein
MIMLLHCISPAMAQSHRHLVSEWQVHLGSGPTGRGAFDPTRS